MRDQMKQTILKLSFILILFFTNYLVGQSISEEKLNLMQNSLLLGLEESGIKIAAEIISEDKYKSVKEKALFSIAEYFFSEGLIGTLDENTRLNKDNIQYLNRAYTFYLQLEKEFTQGIYFNIAQERIKYLELNFTTNLMFRSLANYVENERLIVEKK